MSRFALTCIVAFSICILARPAYCWDKYGHILISEIAYEQLTPTARQHVDDILKTLQNDPHVSGLEAKYQPYNAITIGAWMDDMRVNQDDTAPGHTADFNTWHYVDLPDGSLTPPQIAAGFANDAEPNVYDILVHKCLPAINNASMSDADRARYIGMFFHLAEDIHQPLHCIGRQMGGNGYDITPLPDYNTSPDVWHIKNLHAFWDNAYRYDVVGGKIVVVCSTDDQPRTMKPDGDDIQNEADSVILPFTPSDKSMLDDVDPADWASESHKIAIDFAFPKGSPTTLPLDYIHEAHIIACTRMALAGERIAAVLNKAFSN